LHHGILYLLTVELELEELLDDCVLALIGNLGAGSGRKQNSVGGDEGIFVDS
jgi:hypothetical protein